MMTAKHAALELLLGVAAALIAVAVYDAMRQRSEAAAWRLRRPVAPGYSTV